MRLPEEFLREMKQLLGEEYEVWLNTYEAEVYRGLRVNTGKISPKAFQKLSAFSMEPVPWTENGFYLESDERASRHPYYAAGLYYLQEPSAMTPAACLPILEGDRVLDLCAAPGGKATELAARLHGTGILVANDISSSRAKALLKNLELFGAGNILVTSETPERLCRYFEGWFDKILIDAPCSGEGMFRKEPSMVKEWEEHGPAYYAKLQKEIVTQAAKLLRPGGLLVYSTCTFSVQENEDTLNTLKELEGGFHLLPLPLPASKASLGFQPGRAGCSEAGRLYPHHLHGEGHFVALLQKAETGNCGGENSEKSVCSDRSLKALKLPEEWNTFAKNLKPSWDPARFRLYDGHLYLLPEPLLKRNIRGLRFLRTGLLLGEVKQKRFEPSQALAMALHMEDFSCTVNLQASDERVLRYLKGETLDVEELVSPKEKGWCLVCLDGYPLGWGKLAGGTLKNKYYPGWRW